MTESNQQKQSDFWWLTSKEVSKYKYVCVCHQDPYSDEPNSSRDPLSVPRYFSLDTFGNLSRNVKYYPIDFIYCWRKKNNNINVFRSFSLFSDEHNGEELCGPFILDIDRDYESNKGYVQDISKALEDTRQLVSQYLEETDFRIFFTGHKGFNIEVRPQAFGIVSMADRRRQFECRLRDINKRFSCSMKHKFVDKVHNEVRLHDSINRWVANNGKTMNRMKFELSLDELNSMTAKQICEKSERLARDYLSATQAV